jgi:hypothetical protein
MTCIICNYPGPFMNPPPCNCPLSIHGKCYADLYFDYNVALCDITSKNTENVQGTDAAKCQVCQQFFGPPTERMELYDNNTLLYSIGYLNGQLHGSFKEFWPNGTLKKRTNVVNGKIHGLYTEYNSDGSMKKHCIIMEGACI